MLKLSNISKKFADKKILADVNLYLKKGEMVCLSGPSGIGKTTILDICAGLTLPDTGRQWLGSKRIGYSFQNSNLIPWRSAIKNINFVLSGSMVTGDYSKKGMFWLEKLGLANAAHKKPAEMSGGMCRRLCLAMALAGDPELLFLDEPFAFLDKDWQHRVADELKSLNSSTEMTILIASHELPPIERMGANIVYLSEQPISFVHSSPK
jgi:ABC-type nitrate/sulfonate/bicarbonate transport system ATPase subunit